jgi:hypothetical protein
MILGEKNNKRMRLDFQRASFRDYLWPKPHLTKVSETVMLATPRVI